MTAPRLTSSVPARSRLLAAGAAGILALGVLGAGAPAADASSVTVLTDSFTRSVASGWGSAEIGGAWTVRGGTSARYAVDGAAGTLRLTPGDGPNVDANGVTALDQEILATVSTDRIAVGGGNYVALVARRHTTNELYGVQLNLGVTKPVLTLFRRDAAQAQVTIGVPVTSTATLVAGASWKVRFSVTGTGTTTLSARAWPAASAEPVAWTVTAIDRTPVLQSPGSPGFATFLSTKATNTPIVVSLRDITLVSATPPLPVPAAPQGLVATAGDGRVALSWAAVPTATAYTVQRDGAMLATVSSPAYADTGVVNGTRYSYVVLATNASGSSAPCAAVAATPMPPLPSAPTDLAAAAGDGRVVLSWTAVAGATGYRVLRDGAAVATPLTPSYVDTLVTNGTEYSYRVQATNLAGTSTSSTDVTARPMAPLPATPSGLAGVAGDSQVALSWNAVADASGYRVYRGGVLVASPCGRTQLDTGLVNGTTYAYAVAAVNPSGASAPSANVSVTPVRAGRASASAGAPALGSTSYAIPAGSVFVATSGSDGDAGTIASPVATVAKALSLIPSGGTVVLRGGVYHQGGISVTKAATIQSYPGEVVWFDGATRVTGWTAQGAMWRSDGWTAAFDHSPTYTAGAPDSTQPGWSFVNAAYPMAAYPDMVWIDGTELAQVASAAAVTAGTFFVDTTNHRLYIGTDPTARTVEASDLQKALAANASNVTFRGFGVRRYATSVPMMGTVILNGTNGTAADLVISDNATQGLIAANKSGDTVSHVTVTHNGLLGMAASYADNLTVVGLLSTYNNDEHFNGAPVSGGFKLARARNLTVRDSVLRNNYGPGLWFDESAYNMTIVGNELTNNSGHGLSVEISDTGVIADNIVTDNGGNGMKINNAGHLTIWNNTIARNGKDIWIVQDGRDQNNLSTAGHDPRQVLPDASVPWKANHVSVRNNVLTNSTGNSLVAVEDLTKALTAEQMDVTTDYNQYTRTSSSIPAWLVVWSAGTGNGGNPYVYGSLTAFRTAKAQEQHSVSSDNGAACATPTPVGLTAVLAGLLARPVGDLHMGAY